MLIEVRQRGKVLPIPGASARALASNAWEITIPRTPDTQRLFGPDLRRLDGAVLVLDGQESEPALISAEGADMVRVSAWVLG